VAELEPRAVADEDVYWREIAMKQLTAVQFPKHVEDACDLAPHGALGPSLFLRVQIRAEIAVRGVLEHEIADDTSVRPHVREHVEDTNRARMIVQQLAEIGFAEPSIDPRAHLQADCCRNDGRVSNACRK